MRMTQLHTRLFTASIVAALFTADASFAADVRTVPPPPPKGPLAVALSRPVQQELSGPFPARLQVQTVLPEVSTAVTLSNSDINRITCREEIRDVVFSREKGLSVKVAGRDAFVKFLITRKEGKEVYSSTPSELFVVCGENVYSLIAMPGRVPSRTVRLSPGSEKISQNRGVYRELPFEKKVLALIRSVYTGEIPEGVSTVAVNKSLPLFRDLEVRLVRTHRLQGEGLQVLEYLLASKRPGEPLRFSEKDFLSPAVSAGPVAIAIDRHELSQGDTARLTVVEQALSVAEGGVDGAQGED